jgi:predicted DNA-binding mobile mystery protein A
MRRLRLEQLDKRTGRLRSLLEISSPRDGWVKRIREGLGISARQLAEKIGVSQPTLAKIEKSEVERTVSFKTLDRIAEALECKMIYALIPKDSFEKLVRKRAHQAAEILVKRISHSMDLEKQGLSAKKRQAQVEEIAEEMARTLSKELWEHWK